MAKTKMWFSEKESDGFIMLRGVIAMCVVMVLFAAMISCASIALHLNASAKKDVRSVIEERNKAELNAVD